MSSYKGHLAGGVAFYTIALLVISRTMLPSVPTMIEWLLCCLAGSLFPDVDIKSKGQKLFYHSLLLILIYLMVAGHYDVMAFLAICAVVPLVVRHRGLFHRIWFVIVVPALAAWIICALWFPGCSQIIFYDVFFFILGAISHLWLDFGVRRLFRF